jgi:hypothetical protein
MVGKHFAIIDGTATQTGGDYKLVHRFTPEPNGLRWTQTITNTRTNAIAVGPQFFWRMGQGGERPAVVPASGSHLPIEIGVFPASDIGVSVIQPPEEAIWKLGQRRLDPGQSITFTALVRVHEADWRPGVALLVQEYPEYFNPPNPRVHQIAGGGAYSTSWETPDPAASLAMGFRCNWKASFDLAGFGMYVAPTPVDVNTTWKDIRGNDNSIAKMAKYATAMKAAGFHVLNYFNITEAGFKIQQLAPPRVAKKDEDLWRNPNDWIHYGIRDAVLESEGKLIGSWGDSVVVDPAEPKFRAHLVDQATRLVRDTPDADGVCIDRMDHLSKINGRRYDGMGLYNGQASGAWLLLSWKQVMDDLGPIFHKADKVILGNPLRTYTPVAFRHLDGIYTEDWAEMESCSLLCVNKPLIVWSGPYDDAGMQKLLHHGAWPTCPMAGNDHCEGPDKVKEALVADYGRMFDALRGRRWALHARPIACEDVPSAKLNLFHIPGGYLASITAVTNATQAKIRLPALPLPAGVDTLKAWSITPGGDWTPLAVERKGADWTFTAPVGRGCGVVRLHWAWVEPFQPWWKVRPSIEINTTVPGAVIRATTDGKPATDKSPVWKSSITPAGSMTLRAGIWKDGKQVGEELISPLIETP